MIRSRTFGIVSSVLGAALVVGAYLLFRGYIDGGSFQVMSDQRSATGEVAVAAQFAAGHAGVRNEYFVVLGDHVFSPRELRHAYAAHDEVFSTERNCLTLAWIDAHHLQITCDDRSIQAEEIVVQRHQSGSTSISYSNISNK
jgi:hypothetical protein